MIDNNERKALCVTWNSLLTNNKVDINSLTDAIIESNNGEIIYIFIVYFVKHLEQEIINSLTDALISLADNKHVIELLKTVDLDEDTKNKLIHLIMASNDTYYIYQLTGVEGAPIDKIINIALEIKDYEYIINVLKKIDIDEVLKNKLVNFIKESNNSNYIYQLLEVKGISIATTVDTLIAMKDVKHIIDVLKKIDIDETTKKKLIDFIIASNNSTAIYQLLEVKEISIDEIVDIAIKKGNLNEICWLVVKEGAPVNKIVDAVIESKLLDCIYFVAKYVKGELIDKLADAIIESKDIKYIRDFIQNISMNETTKRKFLKTYFLVDNKESSEQDCILNGSFAVGCALSKVNLSFKDRLYIKLAWEKTGQADLLNIYATYLLSDSHSEEEANFLDQQYLKLLSSKKAFESKVKTHNKLEKKTQIDD